MQFEETQTQDEIDIKIREFEERSKGAFAAQVNLMLPHIALSAYNAVQPCSPQSGLRKSLDPYCANVAGQRAGHSFQNQCSYQSTPPGSL